MKKKSWRKQSQQVVIDIGPCKYCGKDMLNTDSFVAFMDKTKAHYKCMKEDHDNRSESLSFKDSNLI